MPLRTIDLCAGIGGIRKGFEMTGQFVNVLSAEVDRFACMTYEHLYNENPHNDLTSIEFKNRIAELEYDVLLAGFPCQTFSRAGLEAGFNDEKKGIIFNHIAEIVERTRPRAVFLENVDNLIRHDGGNTMRTIIERLEVTLNYKVIGVTYDENAGGGVSTPSVLWINITYSVGFVNGVNTKEDYAKDFWDSGVGAILGVDYCFWPNGASAYSFTVGTSYGVYGGYDYYWCLG